MGNKNNHWGSWGKGSNGLVGLGMLEQYKGMAAHAAGLVLARKGENMAGSLQRGC